MSYLTLFKQADAQLRSAAPGNAVDALNAESANYRVSHWNPVAESGDREAQPNAESAGYRVNRVNRVPESSPTPDPGELARVLGLPLDQLDRVLTVRVPWQNRPLWFVPSESDAEALVASGEATRGAVWTRQELLDMLTIPNITKTGARTLAVAKLEFDGDVVDVRVRGLEAPKPERPPSRPAGGGRLASPGGGNP